MATKYSKAHELLERLRNGEKPENIIKELKSDEIQNIIEQAAYVDDYTNKLMEISGMIYNSVEELEKSLNNKLKILKNTFRKVLNDPNSNKFISETEKKIQNLLSICNNFKEKIIDLAEKKEFDKIFASYTIVIENFNTIEKRQIKLAEEHLKNRSENKVRQTR